MEVRQLEIQGYLYQSHWWESMIREFHAMEITKKHGKFPLFHTEGKQLEKNGYTLRKLMEPIHQEL
jgi:hypothetical protein